MPEVREVAFELERFGWTPPDHLEVVGRWSGLEGRRLGRPTLTLHVGDEAVRLTAHPGGHFSRSGTWSAVFSYDGKPEAVDGAELEIGRRMVVDLPPPRRRSTPAGLAHERKRREELEATLAERDAEITGLRDEAETAIGDRDTQIETLTAELAELRGRLETTEPERDDLQSRLESAETERDDLRTRLEAAEQAVEEMRAELEAAREEAEIARAEVEQRLMAERAASTEIREKLATAREEAQSTIDTEAQETERLRAELQAARDETERTVEAERAETARLREELATRSTNGSDEDGSESDPAAKRMYERVARELERERAAARHLRRELDAVQAQTAEHRRIAASAAANGIDPESEDLPAAATPAGRLVAARSTDVGRMAAHHRAEAARAAAAHRVPSHRSPVAVWTVRAIAVAFVGGLLVALLQIVNAVT
jgi:hypothetical protein